jgi:hypothetical protein
MSWKDVNKELPPPKVKVKLSYGLVGIKGAVCDEWVSEGWIHESGTWSVKRANNMPKYARPSHWKHLDE